LWFAVFFSSVKNLSSTTVKLRGLGNNVLTDYNIQIRMLEELSDKLM